MKKLVEYKLDDGSTVWIEVDEQHSDGMTRASRFGDAVDNAQYLFEDSLSKLKPITKALVSTMTDMGPDEATVEFGVKLSTTAGIVIASANSEVNFTFKLTWKRKPEPVKP